MTKLTYNIKITGNGTAQEIIKALHDVIGGIEEAIESEHPESAILDGAEWESETLITKINEGRVEQKDYSGDYSSIHEFISENELGNKANEVFGENWEPENDIEMVGELLDDISTGYNVANKGQKTENYIHVWKS